MNGAKNAYNLGCRHYELGHLSVSLSDERHSTRCGSSALPVYNDTGLPCPIIATGLLLIVQDYLNFHDQKLSCSHSIDVEVGGNHFVWGWGHG